MEAVALLLLTQCEPSAGSKRVKAASMVKQNNEVFTGEPETILREWWGFKFGANLSIQAKL